MVSTSDTRKLVSNYEGGEFPTDVTAGRADFRRQYPLSDEDNIQSD
jgi:hypothetical protein